jgi:hypothetical protein
VILTWPKAVGPKAAGKDACPTLPSVAQASLPAAFCQRLLAVFTPITVFAADGKFELVSEKQIPELPFGRSGDLSTLSPDGRSVLIIRDGGLFTRPLESRDEKQILPARSLAAALANWAEWSPDSAWIYYLQKADMPGNNDLWRMDAEGHKKELLIKKAGGVSNSKPRPSPDGKSLAFFRGQALLTADTDGRNERVVCEHCDPGWLNMTWSPDSSQILMVAGPNPYVTGFTKLNLVTIATGQVKALAQWKGVVTSFVWPSWSSGPFLTVQAYDPAQQRSVGFWEVMFRGVPDRDCPVWHLRLPQEERSQVSREHASYNMLLGAGADGHSLVAIKMPQGPSHWDLISSMFGASQRPVAPAVVLTVR